MVISWDIAVPLGLMTVFSAQLFVPCTIDSKSSLCHPVHQGYGYKKWHVAGLLSRRIKL